MSSYGQVILIRNETSGQIIVIIWGGQCSIFSWFEMIQHTPPTSSADKTLQVTARQDPAPDPAPMSRNFNQVWLKEPEEPRAVTWPSNSPDPKAIQDSGMLIYPLPNNSETKRTQWQLRTIRLSRNKICHLLLIFKQQGESCPRIWSPGAIWSMKTPKRN